MKKVVGDPKWSGVMERGGVSEGVLLEESRFKYKNLYYKSYPQAGSCLYSPIALATS